MLVCSGSGNTKSRLSSGISINTSSPYRPLKKPSLIPFLDRRHASTRSFFSSSSSEEKQLHFSGKFTSHPRTPFSSSSSIFPLLLVRILGCFFRHFFTSLFPFLYYTGSISLVIVYLVLCSAFGVL